MSAYSPIGRHVRRLREGIVHQMWLAFQRVLPQKIIDHALAERGTVFRERIFSPAVTLWASLAQVLDSDPSCRQAVSRVIVHFRRQGLHCPSNHTGATLEGKARPDDLWCGRPIKAVDGSTVSMPDTGSSQKAYPQPSSQAAGAAFPRCASSPSSGWSPTLLTA